MRRSSLIDTGDPFAARVHAQREHNDVPLVPLEAVDSVDDLIPELRSDLTLEKLFKRSPQQCDLGSVRRDDADGRLSVRVPQRPAAIDQRL